MSGCFFFFFGRVLWGFNENNVDHDRTPRSAASDLGLHCLPMSVLGDARLEWVDEVNYGH